MINTRLAALAIAAVACAGCSTALVRDTPKPVAVSGGVSLETKDLTEALLDIKGTVVQGVSGSWKENAFSAEFVMKGDGEKLTVAVLAPAMRLATITLTRPHSSRYERARKIPAAFEPEYVLFDLAIVNLETSVLSRVLGPQFSVYDDGTNRVVSLSGKQGQDNSPSVAMLVRNSDGTMKFVNLKHSYEYTITPLQ